MLYPHKIGLEAALKGSNITSWSWTVDGFRVKWRDRICAPLTAYKFRTVVFKENNEEYTVFVNYRIRWSTRSGGFEVANFSSLEKLREEFPKLFELEGIMNY